MSRSFVSHRRGRPWVMIALASLLMGLAPALAQDEPSIRDGSDESEANAASASVAPEIKAQPSGQSKLRLVLSYIDQRLKSVDVGGGSLVEGVEGVKRAIEESGLDPVTHAALIVEVTPRYERYAQGLYAAKVDVGSPNLQIDPRIDGDTQAKLRAEARNFMLRLKNWSHVLDEAESRSLFGYAERVDIPLTTPFERIQTWSYRTATLALRLESPRKPRPILSYVLIGPEGERETLYRLPVGQPFWVEARYISLPTGATQTAELNWGSGGIQVVLQSTDRLLLYRAGPYYIAPPAVAAEEPASP